MRRRAAGLLGTVLLALACAGLPADSLAQCSMCAANAEASGEGRDVRGTFLGAVGLLLIPTVGLLGGAGVLLWKFREPRG